MPESLDPKDLAPRDKAWIALIAENTRWGERSGLERRAFWDRLLERRERHGRAPWKLAALAGGVAAAALAMLVVLPHRNVPRLPHEDSLPVTTARQADSGFLSAAYYGGVLSGGGDATPNGYLPSDYQPWADALDASDPHSF